MKKLLALTVAVITAFSLVACGGNNAGNSAAGGKNAHHQGRSDGMGAGRRSRQQSAAAGAAPTAGSAGAPDRQRDAGGAEPADRPGETGGTAARPMREENFPPKIRREVLRSVPYVLFEERPSKVDGEDPTGYGEQYRSFVGGRQPSELPKGAADHTQDRKGEEDL